MTDDARKALIAFSYFLDELASKERSDKSRREVIIELAFLAQRKAFDKEWIAGILGYK